MSKLGKARDKPIPLLVPKNEALEGGLDSRRQVGVLWQHRTAEHKGKGIIGRAKLAVFSHLAANIPMVGEPLGGGSLMRIENPIR